MSERLPIVDVSALVADAADAPLEAHAARGAGCTAAARAAAAAIGAACERDGFFYATGHGVDLARLARLEDLSRRFFALDLADKMKIRMELGGRAWRGYFPPGAELTSGVPDRKEGLYFGAELGSDHPLVRAGTPMHGANLFPDLPGFREAVLAHLDALTALGHALARGLSLSLGLPAEAIGARLTGEPLILFRIFNYPPAQPGDASGFGVGEHTDYGLLTILHQDAHGGLEVRARSGWIEAPPIEGAFVCNIGDMLDRLTGGRYRSTPHRVRNRSREPRLSFPFFFDPGFFCAVEPLLPAPAVDDRDARWDRASVHEIRGTYGDYLLAKVERVFPQLARAVR